MGAAERLLGHLLPSLSGLPRAVRLRRLIVVLESYVDDSGSGDPPVYLLAGFVARGERWLEFLERWSEALDGPPKLNYFKMSEAAALEGQFKGWTEEEREDRLSRLVNIIKDHVLLGMSSVVYHRDYNDVIRDKISPEVDSPYWLMYHAIMEIVYRWEIHNGITEKVNFIFDEQFKQSDIVQASWTVYYEQSPPELKKLFGERPTHKRDIDTYPLQAADMLAWHIRRAYYEHERGNEFISPTMEVLRTIEHMDRLWTRERLQEFIVRIHAMNIQPKKVTSHQYRDMIANLPISASRINLDIIGKTPSNATGLLAPFLAIGTKRFLLVDSCPFSHNPHLHRRRGNSCLLQEQASVPLAGSDTLQ